MKAAFIACILLGLSAQAFADDNGMVGESEGRFLYFNSTSTAASLSLLGALLLFLVIGYLVFAGGLLGSSSYGYYNRNDPYQYDPYDESLYGAQYRSATDYGMNGLNIIQWISMLQDVYEKFDYNDLDCQKRLICEVMREPEYYGTVARKFKTGFQYAKYLEVLNLPDDMRELLDEYLDANNRAEQQKECEDFFTCPYSLKDSMKRNIADTNNL